MCGQCPVDDFIGQTFPTPKGGVLTIVGIHGKTKGGIKIYSTHCSICSEDKELFPNFFETRKGDLIKGCMPCGCSKSPKWKHFQIYIIISRSCEEIGYEYLGFPDGYRNARSKFEYICNIHGKQTTSYDKFVNGGRRCPSCGIEATKDKLRNPNAETTINEICKKEEYEYLGFPDGYRNARSKFEYICNIHGKQIASYVSFVNGGRRCPSCATSGYQKSKPGHLYVTNWINYDKDTNEFFKIGITNFLEQRIKQQSRKTSYKPHQLIVFKFEDGSIPKS